MLFQAHVFEIRQALFEKVPFFIVLMLTSYLFLPIFPKNFSLAPQTHSIVHFSFIFFLSSAFLREINDYVDIAFL